jgi:hypothetical protein
MSVHLFGIRHHGVGSARSLVAALHDLQPDCILIEGPPEADDLLSLMTATELQPPISLLVYDPEQPRRAAWYPFAVYSPEWQAIRYALAQGIAVRFMDLPLKHLLALETEAPIAPSPTNHEAHSEEAVLVRFDPLQKLAEMAGETDGERWWNRVVEETTNPIAIFELIGEAMAELRHEGQALPAHLQQREDLREAWMRKTVRSAEKDHQRVAVVCGAWHVPALNDRANHKEDTALLKGLASVKTLATIAPWTYARLASESGYGAGIASPGWYHHLWETPSEQVSASWLSKMAMLLREEGLVASTAQVIDALRLSETLVVLRGRASIGLDDLMEAARAVLWAGREEPLALIYKQLIISDRMGSVPASAPAVPLQRDLEAHQKRLRLKVSHETVELDLDLRQANDLQRSVLFHRLNLLDLPWAQLSQGRVRGTGTFHEFWALAWTPELAIRLIEQSVWGNTIVEAAIAYMRHHATEASQIAVITRLLQQVLLATLGEVTAFVLKRLDDIAAMTHDMSDLLKAAPPLIETLRYGDVRRTESDAILPVLESLVIRLCIGLKAACLNIDDDLASELNASIEAFHRALPLAEQPPLVERWHTTLHALAIGKGVHPIIMGTATRFLLRDNQLSTEDTVRLMRLALTPANPPVYAAQWLEGFLSGMEQILVRDETLFGLIDIWVMSLTGDTFEEMLPLVRRTFSTFGAPARRTIAERIQHGKVTTRAFVIDEDRANRALSTLRQILGQPT